MDPMKALMLAVLKPSMTAGEIDGDIP